MNSPQQRVNQCLRYLIVLFAISVAVALTACTAETSKAISDSEITPKASATTSVPCTNCLTPKEDAAHPNKQETVAEEGDIQQWNEGCKCYQTYHYHDDARQVCCYWPIVDLPATPGRDWMGRSAIFPRNKPISRRLLVRNNDAYTKRRRQARLRHYRRRGF